MGIINFLKKLDFFISLQNKHISQFPIVIYCEGRHQWLHLKDVLDNLIKEKCFKILFLSSDNFFPYIENKNIKFVNIGSKGLRRWVFQNINCKVFILSITDLDNLYLKKSRFKPTYIYMPHSLISLTAGYNEKAFVNYDIIVCANKYQYNEAKTFEKIYNFKYKNLLTCGYFKNEFLKKNYRPKEKKQSALIAPTWGNYGLIETMKIFDIIKILIQKEIKVILQPHPETLKKHHKIIGKIQSLYGNNSYFDLNLNLSDLNPIYRSHFLISDWSGIIFEYNIAFKKPIILFNTSPKINNKNYKKYKIEPIEFIARESIATCINDTSELEKAICNLHSYPTYKKAQFRYNISNLTKLIKSNLA